MAVVSYRNSTSNHNTLFRTAATLLVVSYRNSTSNHNKNRGGLNFDRLYLIEILHQTTTMADANTQAKRLYLIEILHQTTTLSLTMFGFPSCILSKFYIKPQLRIAYPVEAVGCILSKFYIKPQLAIHPAADLFVVSYRNSTSNHNFPPRIVCKYGVVSYRNSTSNHNNVSGGTERTWVVSYRNSTSNHNCCMN